MEPHPRLVRIDSAGNRHAFIDPYSFAPTLSPADLAMLASGGHVEAWRMLGAHPARIDGIAGVRFAVWAPNAERVSVVGPFCDWDGRRLPMRVLGGSGVWELFLPGLAVGEIYKFEIASRHGGASAAEDRSVRARDGNAAGDGLDRHRSGQLRLARRRWLDRAPDARLAACADASIYEVHPRLLAAPRRRLPRLPRTGRAARFPTCSASASRTSNCCPCRSIRWTIPGATRPPATSRRPAASARPMTFATSSTAATRPASACCSTGCRRHFPRDAHGSPVSTARAVRIRGSAQGRAPATGARYIFNYERHEVKSFLLASACYWLEEYHFDGLRVDAVASMLYLDFARRHELRAEPAWRPREPGGDGVPAHAERRHAFAHPGTLTIAEESTDWPMVSRPWTPAASASR
jgi:1,4-alpha-glucan branching enzyme